VLAKGEEFDVYRFRVPQRITIPVSILVPTRDDLEDFRPSFALIGPGLGDAGAGSPTPMAPQSVLERVAALELATDSDPDVVIVSAPPEQWGSFFEPFSFERYYQGPEVQISVEPGTDYYVAVFHPARQEGDYVLGLGTRESFGPGDVFSSIVAVGRIKLGLYGQGEIRWGALAIGLGMITLIVALAVGLLVRSRRRRRSRDGGPTARSETPPDTVLDGR
jgi:hypothetical protein